jgi:hypothetical protein
MSVRAGADIEREVEVIRDALTGWERLAILDRRRAALAALDQLRRRFAGYEEALDEIGRISMDDSAELVDELRNIARAALESRS